MAFITYAQNFEDVTLWRALKHVQNGRYVDIGAHHPTQDSVSKAFYDHGWRGIHVEPVPAYAELLRQERPDETVLQVALSDRSGMLEFNVIPGTGLSTGVEAFAARHHAQYDFAVETIQVPMLPITEALEALNGQEVHWLKIDVEGLEEAVLKGWDSTLLRPWIIVIEATVPMSRELNFAGADRLLVQAGYQFAYFDGLNRFYVAPEHPELVDSLALPPNVFDEAEFSISTASPWCQGLKQQQANLQAALNAVEGDLASTRQQLVSERERAIAAESKIKALERARIQAERKHQEASAHAAALEQRLDAVLCSTSWRITAPLRWVGSLQSRLRSAIREGRLLSGIKRRIKSAIRTLAKVAARRPVLRWGATTLLRLVPRLDRRLRGMLATPVQADHEASLARTRMAEMLSPEATVVYRQLRRPQLDRNA